MKQECCILELGLKGNKVTMTSLDKDGRELFESSFDTRTTRIIAARLLKLAAAAEVL